MIPEMYVTKSKRSNKKILVEHILLMGELTHY